MLPQFGNISCYVAEKRADFGVLVRSYTNRVSLAMYFVEKSGIHEQTTSETRFCKSGLAENADSITEAEPAPLLKMGKDMSIHVLLDAR